MELKNLKVEPSTITRDIRQFDEKTGNIYEAVAIMARRSNQISTMIREELLEKLEEFGSHSDNLEEIFENREQIEVSKFYEKLPKSTLISVQEFLDDQIYYRIPPKEELQ